MFCTNCGSKLDDDARFCTNCGSKINEQDKLRFDAAQSSLEEGKQTPLDSASIATVSAETPEPTEKQSQAFPGKAKAFNRKTMIIICAIVAAVVALVLAIVGFSSCSSKAVAIDSDMFPNDCIREAVALELDTDGDGTLSPEESDAVTSLVVTPQSVEFITDGEEVDLVEARNAFSAESSSGAHASQGSGSNGNSDTSALNTEDFSQSIKPFSKVKNLVVSNMNVAELDLANLSELEYVDCRNNPIETLDLSNCKNLVSLFCDEGVELTGLDSAALYSRDLISSVAKTGEEQPIIFTYDSMGRILQYEKGSSLVKMFSYDEYGRLVRAQNGSSAYSWYEAYSYGENGLLSKASVYQPLDVEAVPLDYVYEYDDQNRLVKLSSSRADRIEAQAEITYTNDKPSSIQTDDDILSIATDSEGRVSSIDRTSIANGNSLGTCTYGYLEDGQLADWEEISIRESTENPRSRFMYKTSFDDEQYPRETAVEGMVNSFSETAFSIPFKTNNDGYITQMETPNKDGSTLLSGSTLDISYVKHVGRLEDLPAQRYVPVFRVENTVNPLERFTWHLDQDLYASTGSKAVISIVEDGPMQMALQPLGVVQNVVSNPNEQKIAEYMSKHWQDPFELKVAPGVIATTEAIQDESSSSNGSGSQVAPSASSARTVTTDHFTFDMPESWVDKVAWSVDEYTNKGAARDGSDQKIFQYSFYLKGGNKNTDNVLSVMVTNDATGELGQTNTIGDFETSGGLEGYVCYWDGFLNEGGSSNPNAATITGLQSGGQVQYSSSYDADTRMACNEDIKTWLTNNAVPQIKPR